MRPLLSVPLLLLAIALAAGRVSALDCGPAAASHRSARLAPLRALRSLKGVYAGSLKKKKIQGTLDCTDMAEIRLETEITAQSRARLRAALSSIAGRVDGKGSVTESGFQTRFSFVDEKGFQRTVTLTASNVKARSARMVYSETARWPAGGSCLFVFTGRVSRSRHTLKSS